MSARYKLRITYDGTSYGGWQAQKNAPAIQTILEKALSTILRHPVAVVGSGRTDAGVHALGQVAHFDTPAPFEPKRWLLSMNALLPPEIRILDVESTPLEFHARYSAIGKIYHYRLHFGKTADPFKRLFSYHVPFTLDLDLLKKAAPFFIGTHDFSAFANEALKGSAAKNPIRNLRRLDVVEEAGGIRLEFEGEGFLYKMVRNITGTLIDIARGKIALDDLPKIFSAKNRQEAGTTAPPLGLCLVQVLYEEAKTPSREEKWSTPCNSGSSI
jgi:tRNA pseudouridine38-40 synthase